VLRQLFASPEFWASAGAKTRRPLEGFLAVVRMIGSTPGAEGLGGMDDLYWMSRDLGHAPLDWAPPNGYPDVAGAWSSAGAAMRRWNKTTEVVNGWWPSKLVRPAERGLLPAALPATYGELVDGLVSRLLGRGPTGTERAALLEMCGRSEGAALRSGDEWVTWHLNTLVQTVLQSPGHMER